MPFPPKTQAKNAPAADIEAAVRAERARCAAIARGKVDRFSPLVEVERRLRDEIAAEIER